MLELNQGFNAAIRVIVSKVKQQQFQCVEISTEQNEVFTGWAYQLNRTIEERERIQITQVKTRKIKLQGKEKSTDLQSPVRWHSVIRCT